MSKKTWRQIVLWVILLDSPVLYTGAVTLESTLVTTAALVMMGAAAAVAALVY